MLALTSKYLKVDLSGVALKFVDRQKSTPKTLQPSFFILSSLDPLPQPISKNQ